MTSGSGRSSVSNRPSRIASPVSSARVTSARAAAEYQRPTIQSNGYLLHPVFSERREREEAAEGTDPSAGGPLLMFGAAMSLEGSREDSSVAR